MRIPYKTAFILGLACRANSVYAQLRSFGEAGGFGALATGGRTSSIYHVTNLNDSGAGSFRDAVGTSNRIIVFDIGGYINLSSTVLFSPRPKLIQFLARFFCESGFEKPMKLK